MNEQFVKYVIDAITNYPQHKNEIRDLFRLCKDEIAEGGSPQHEMDLCRNDIEELIKS
jgi:hypothetical protein